MQKNAYWFQKTPTGFHGSVHLLIDNLSPSVNIVILKGRQNGTSDETPPSVRK